MVSLFFGPREILMGGICLGVFSRLARASPTLVLVRYLFYFNIKWYN